MKTSGLSLVEAHASGRRYKHKDEEFYTRYHDTRSIAFAWAISSEWELEPEAKLLTREDVEDAFYTALPATKNEELTHIKNMLNRLFGSEEG